MRRTLMVITILLLVGAIVNIAVAWGCAIWYPTGFGSNIEYLDAPPPEVCQYVSQDWLSLHVKLQWADVRYSYRDSSHRPLRMIQFGVTEDYPAADKMGPDRILHIQRAGWPILGVECRALLDHEIFPMYGDPRPIDWVGGFAAPAGLRPLSAEWFLFPEYKRPLPWQPIWPGFAIGTLFYAAILWLLFFVPGKVRRAIRRHRNLCPACAYPIGSSPVCTECGTPVRRSR